MLPRVLFGAAVAGGAGSEITKTMEAAPQAGRTVSAPGRAGGSLWDLLRDLANALPQDDADKERRKQNESTSEARRRRRPRPVGPSPKPRIPRTLPHPVLLFWELTGEEQQRQFDEYLRRQLPCLRMI